MARPVRVRLEDEQVGSPAAKEVPLKVISSSSDEGKSGSTPLLDQLYYGKPKREQIKEFGYLFGAVFAGVGAYYGWYGDQETLTMLSAIGVLTVATGYFVPIVLYPVWSAWMTLADVLSVVVSVLFVLITWCLIAVPVGLLLKVIGKKVMDLSFDRSVESYWEERDEKLHDFELLERQF